MNYTISAKTTNYQGYRFRSRTEARWAVFFDWLGIYWDYEPETFSYICQGTGKTELICPDFYIKAPSTYLDGYNPEYFLEVKPTSVDADTVSGVLTRLRDFNYSAAAFVSGDPLDALRIEASIHRPPWPQYAATSPAPPHLQPCFHHESSSGAGISNMTGILTDEWGLTRNKVGEAALMARKYDFMRRLPNNF